MRRTKYTLSLVTLAAILMSGCFRIPVKPVVYDGEPPLQTAPRAIHVHKDATGSVTGTTEVNPQLGPPPAKQAYIRPPGPELGGILGLLAGAGGPLGAVASAVAGAYALWKRKQAADNERVARQIKRGNDAALSKMDEASRTQAKAEMARHQKALTKTQKAIKEKL